MCITKNTQLSQSTWLTFAEITAIFFSEFAREVTQKGTS